MYSSQGRVWYRRGRPVLHALQSGSDFCAVFDSETGETHFLGALPALVLGEIAREPTQLSELLAKLDAPSDAIEDLNLPLLHALATLEHAELVDSMMVPEA